MKTKKVQNVDLGSHGDFNVHPGKLHAALGIPQDEKLTESDLARGARSASPATRRETASARGLKAMHKG